MDNLGRCFNKQLHQMLIPCFKPYLQYLDFFLNTSRSFIYWQKSDPLKNMYAFLFFFLILFNLKFFVALLVFIFNDTFRIFPLIFPLNFKFFCFLLLYRKWNNVFLTYLNLASILHHRDPPRDHGWKSRLLILEECRM